MQTSVNPLSADPQLILVIEDEAAIAKAIGLTLRGAGFRTCELTGASGIAEALERKPFAVILDVSLQQSDGVEVLRLLAGAKFTGVVQLVSGNTSTILEDVKRVGEKHSLTMLPALRKPFRMRDLRQIMLSERSLRSADPGDTSEAEQKVVSSFELCEVLDQNWQEVWYQPKFDLRTGILVGAESLARARHPTLGILSPASFLPGADERSLERLTRTVIETACSDWNRFNDSGKPLNLAVNITAAQLTTMALADLIRRAVPNAPNWPGLILEVTEEDALRDVDAAHEIATQLAIYGVSLAIDDFGLGYSSLARLSEIPFREVKLDRTLVDECATNKTRGALCKAVVQLAHALGAKVVAEGIERPDDLDYLRRLGCDRAQGFLLGRPMPADELVDFTRQAPLAFANDISQASSMRELPRTPRSTFGRRCATPAAGTAWPTPPGAQVDGAM